jgi:hypothetical protein
MIRQTLKFITAALLPLTMFTACELDEIREDTVSYARIFSINVVYADTTYRFTWNGEPYESFGGYVLRTDTVGTLRAYRDDELELDTAIYFAPGSKLQFIQLPGEKIKFYDAAAGESEPDPTDPTCTKARFFYREGSLAAANDSLRFIWLSSAKANLSLPGAKSTAFDTIVIHRGKLSDYVEFNTDKYAPDNTYFHYTRQTWNGSAWTGTAKTATTLHTAVTGYKFATCEYTSGLQFQLIFGNKWEE